MSLVNLPPEILYNILEFHPDPALASTNKEFKGSIDQIFRTLVRKAHPSLDENPITFNYKQYLVRLVGELKTEAERLGIPQPDLSKLSAVDKMLWSYRHFRSLINVVASETKKAKENDLHKFIIAVVHQIGLPLLPDQNLVDLWKSLTDNQLDQIEELNLTDQNFRFLPPEIGRIRNLKSLYLDRNVLKSLPLEINTLIHLKTLKLDHNNLTEISNNIHLPNLKRLELRHNKLKQVPNLIAYPNLSTIYIHHNQIDRIPSDINSHPNLTAVYLKNNPIININDANDRVIIDEPQIGPNSLVSNRIEGG